MSLANLTTVDKGCDIIFLRLHFVFSREISVAPQLWGNCTTVVGQLHHNCGAVAPQLWGNEYEAEKNNYLADGNNYLGFPSGRLLGRFLLKQGGARGVILQRETIQHGVYASANI